MNIITNKTERTRFVKFALVGVSGTIVDFGFFNLFRFIGISIQIAGGLSFAIAVVNNFLLNRYWIYPEAREKKWYKQFTAFVLINLVGLVIRTGILSFIPNWFTNLLPKLGIQFPFLGFELGFYADNFSVAVAIFIVLFWNYFSNRYYTFNEVDKLETPVEEQA